MAASFWRNRTLIASLTKREVLGRYRGSVLGILWSFFNPLLMLAVYTFVFSVVFQTRWGGSVGQSRGEFALILFAGLMVFNLFAECVTRAPGLVLGNVSYVKRVLFPLEILPWVSLGAALFHLAISFMVWLCFFAAVMGPPRVTVLLFPLILVPLGLLIMGLSWLLASLAVYLRDVGQVVGIAVTLCMFLTPLFYPAAAIPERYRPLLWLNPLAWIVEQTRNLLVSGMLPPFLPSTGVLLFSLLSAWCGFAWFQKTRKGFADVL